MDESFQDAFILDAGKGGVFVWVGKDCTADEREKAMETGAKYLHKRVRITVGWVRKSTSLETSGLHRLGENCRDCRADYLYPMVCRL